ncbi:hypothetical protein U1Q18_014772 [Sarracenia purpurea var. burkii]
MRDAARLWRLRWVGRSDSLNPTDLALKVVEIGFDLPYGFGRMVSREAYLRRVRLRISGTAEGAVEAYAAGTCESGVNASVFATKLLRPLLHVNRLCNVLT